MILGLADEYGIPGDTDIKQALETGDYSNYICIDIYPPSAAGRQLVQSTFEKELAALGSSVYALINHTHILKFRSR